MIVKTDADSVFPYTYDSSNLKGNADIVYIPESIEELKQAIKVNYDNNILINFSGSGTGITGSRVPIGGAVISTEKLKSIIEFNDDYVVIEPGISLLELNEFLEEKGKFLPPNPTEINASIGGNIATNASGARSFKYGAIRNWILGLEIILSNGESIYIERGQILSKDGYIEFKTNQDNNFKIETFDIGMPKVKNASGYYLAEKIDLIDLFIGSEGTLGAYGKIKVRIIDKPSNILGAVIYFDNSKKLLQFVEFVRSSSLLNNQLNFENNQEISARLIEYFDSNSLDLLRPKYTQIPQNAIGAVWIEQEYAQQYEEHILEKWYSIISEYTNLSDDTWIALNDKEHENLREFRHELPLQVYENLTNNSQKKVGLDTAVPDESFHELFKFYLDNFSKLNLQNVIFGHIGNSHLHANIFCKNDEEYQKALEIYDKVIDLSLKIGGTVSAEHGIGKLKKKYLIKMYGQEIIDKMKQIKKTLDTKSLLNIGTMFD